MSRQRQQRESQKGNRTNFRPAEIEFERSLETALNVILHETTRNNHFQCKPQHGVATLLRYCFEWLQRCFNIATLCCGVSSPITSPLPFENSDAQPFKVPCAQRNNFTFYGKREHDYQFFSFPLRWGNLPVHNCNLSLQFDHVYTIGGVTYRMLPHLSEVPHLHVNSP